MAHEKMYEGSKGFDHRSKSFFLAHEKMYLTILVCTQEYAKKRLIIRKRNYLGGNL
jgi:hypothetical protein